MFHRFRGNGDDRRRATAQTGRRWWWRSAGGARRALRKPPAQRRSSLPVRRADREPRLLRDTHRRRPRRLGRSSSKPAAAMLGAVARELRNRVRAKTWVDSPGWATAATSLHNKMWLRNKV